MQKIRVMVADDHALIRDGLRVLVGAEPDMEIVAEAQDGEETWQMVQHIKPDVVLLDIAMPKMNCEQLLKTITSAYPAMKVLIVSASVSEPLVRQMRVWGASGYIHKHIDFTRLAKAIRLVVHGEKVFARSMVSTEEQPNEGDFIDNIDESGLPVRDVELIKLVARGYGNQEIAQIMHLSVKTIESYKTKISAKMGFKTRAALVSYALKRGWLFE